MANQQEKDHDLLVALHEQMKQVRFDLGQIRTKIEQTYVDPELIKSHSIKIEILENDVQGLKEVAGLNRKILFGMVALILVAVAGAVIESVLVK